MVCNVQSLQFIGTDELQPAMTHWQVFVMLAAGCLSIHVAQVSPSESTGLLNLRCLVSGADTKPGLGLVL